MKVKSLLFIAAFCAVLVSCSTADEISGTYTGSYQTNHSQGASGGTAIVTSAGSNSVNIVFKAPGDPDIVINGVAVQKIFNVITLDIDDVTGTISCSGSVTGGMMTLNYDSDVDWVQFSGSK